MPYLAFNLNDGNEFVFDILEERLSIGRDVKNDIVIDNTYISGFHAEFIRQADGVYELVDLKSSNGTFVNGKRIDRVRVKGGDKIRFGQLDSRFRERAPKGTAPSVEAKLPPPAKGSPVRPDGRRGDTESVPARDAEASSETSPVGPNKIPLARTDLGIKGPSFPAAQGALIQRPAAMDPALQKQAEELREEVAKLQKERELLRIENESETKRRDEIRALEKQIEERQKAALETEAKLEGLNAAILTSKADVAKLEVKRREAANLDSQLESTRSELAKVQSDIAMAQKSLQSLHADADRANVERSTHLKEKEAAVTELAALRQQIQAAESDLKEPTQVLAAAGGPSTTEDFDTRSDDIRALDEDIATKKTELAQVQQTVENLRQEETQRSANIQTLAAKESNLTQVTRALGEMESKRSLLDAALAGLMGNQSTVEAKLAGLEKQCAEASVRLRDLSSERSQAMSDHQALNVTKLQLETQLNELRRHSEHLVYSHKKAEEEAHKNLAAIEEKVRVRSEELNTLESRSSELTHRLSDLASADTQLSSSNDALKAIESHKGDLSATLAQMTQERETLARDLLSATEKGRAQHSLTQTLTVSRETLENEIRGIEEKKESLTEDVQKARENLRLAEAALTERQQEAKAAEAKTQEFTAKASDVVEQHATLQKEITALRDQINASRMELDKTTAEAAAKTKAAEIAGTAEQKHRQQASELQGKVAQLEALLVTLAATQTDRQQSVSNAEQKVSELQSQATEAGKKLSDVQTEAARLNAELATAKQELEQAKADAGTQQKAAQEALADTDQRLADSRASLAAVTQDLEKAQAACKCLQTEQGDYEKRLPAMRAEAGQLQTEVATQLKDLAAGESRVVELTQQTTELAAKAKELANIQDQLEKGRSALSQATGEHAKITALLLPLVAQRQDHEQVLPGLKSEVENVRAELSTLLRDKQSTASALEKAQSDRKAAFDQAEALRAEAANLDKLLNDKRSNLEAETKAKLAEAAAAETKLRELQAKITAGEKRAVELVEVEQKFNHAVLGVRDAEKQRLNEEKSLGELARQQEALRKDISKFDAESRQSAAHLAELTKRAKAEEARAADAESRLQKASAAAQSVESKRLEAEAVATRAREEEKLLRKQIPALTTELAGLQSMLVSLTKEREEASQFVTRLNVTTESSNKKLSELQQQISQLEDAHKMREERLMKAQEEVDKEAARLKAAHESTRTAEQTLHDIEKEVKESRQRADSARTQATGLETELNTRMDRVEKLKLEETRLIKELEAQKAEVQVTGAVFAELQDKIRHEEGRLSEFTHVSGKILTLGATLAGLEARQGEAGKSLRDAAERELALQVKINALQESLNRESARAEQVKKERMALDTELGTFTELAEKQAAALHAQEIELRKRLTDLETQVRDKSATAERLKSELTVLNDRRAEFAQAEAQLHHWKEIETRLRGQLLELEEKHEVLRRGLPTEESTVVMFANDIIKRIDLIDALNSRYAGYNGGDVVAQLRTLRHSFEDILFQHGISEFDIGAGTEVDVDLRMRITVVESVPGKNKPRVVETCRSGFIYSREEGHEIVLRKVEVRTSSH